MKIGDVVLCTTEYHPYKPCCVVFDDDASFSSMGEEFLFFAFIIKNVISQDSEDMCSSVLTDKGNVVYFIGNKALIL